ncbi:MAG TPA: tRNA pseudouridine(38-40) synthase TruA [Fluviicola sp.]|nr:tRNA pseudouridine(38-40) synthase TruA [Fluviicola sp.]
MSENRFFIELAYDGTAYAGWQRQPNALSVQETLELQLSKLLSGKEIPVTGCGRTDAGVHAHFFVAHVQLPETTDLATLKHKLNKMLPNDIAIFRIYPVSEDMHARFQATSRTYRYYLHQEKDAFLKNSLYFPRSLNFDRMNEAAKFFLGKQDFTSLSKLHTDVKTNICTVTEAVWKQDGNQWYFEITADRFLRNMVRATVGTLLDVGIGKLEPETIVTILEAKDRGEAKHSVDACGLFLWNVVY